MKKKELKHVFDSVIEELREKQIKAITVSDLEDIFDGVIKKLNKGDKK